MPAPPARRRASPTYRARDSHDAFAAAAVPNSILVFAGDGPLRAQIISEAETLGIASRVRILGFTNQSQLPAVYCGADLFVLSSSYDPCPVVVCGAGGATPAAGAGAAVTAGVLAVFCPFRLASIP